MAFGGKLDLAIYRFDAMFDTESALPDHSQLFETFALQNCRELSVEYLESVLFWFYSLKSSNKLRLIYHELKNCLVNCLQSKLKEKLF